MYRTIISTAALALALAVPSVVAAKADPAGLDATGTWDHAPVGDAPTPPMGWNSWNAFKLDLSEAGLVGSARVIVDRGFDKLGYRSINIDDGWFLQRDAGGRIVVRTNVFPSAVLPDGKTSLKPLVDRLHDMGLKVGIYSDIGRNVCSQGFNRNQAWLPQGTQAQREVGLGGHVLQDVRLYFGEWGFDAIKVDACGIAWYGPDRPNVADGTFRMETPLIAKFNPGRDDLPAVRTLYADLRDALRTVRPRGDFVLSVCNWGTANVRAWGKDVGTMWRSSSDITPTWGALLHNFDSVKTRELYAGPGHWNDPDMLEIGNGEFDAAHLTEARAHMAAWAVLAAPLIIGTDLVHASPKVLEVLGNPEVVAVNQDPAGNQGVLAYTDSEREIMVKTLGKRGTKAVLLLNRSASPTTITLNANHLKMAGDRPIALRDLTAQRDLGAMNGTRSFALAPHQALLLRAAGVPLSGPGWFLSEMPGRTNVAVDGVPAPQLDPTVYNSLAPIIKDTSSDGYRPAYFGWGGPRADATPYAESLALGGQLYRTGLGVLANSRLQWRANGEFRRLDAKVGVDDNSRGRNAAVRFEVWGDGRLLKASPDQRFGMPPVEITADVTGVKVIELIARQSRADVAPVLATWADAHVE